MKSSEGRKIKTLSTVDAINYLKGITCLREFPDSENHFEVVNGRYVFWVGEANRYYSEPGENCLIYLMDWHTKNKDIVSFHKFLDSASEEVVESFSFHLDMFR